MIARLLRLFQTPTAAQLAADELAEAERELLKAQSGVEFAQSNVDYNQARVKRLRAFAAPTQEAAK